MLDIIAWKLKLKIFINSSFKLKCVSHEAFSVSVNSAFKPALSKSNLFQDARIRNALNATI